MRRRRCPSSRGAGQRHRPHVVAICPCVSRHAGARWWRRLGRLGRVGSAGAVRRRGGGHRQDGAAPIPGSGCAPEGCGPLFCRHLTRRGVFHSARVLLLDTQRAPLDEGDDLALMTLDGAAAVCLRADLPCPLASRCLTSPCPAALVVQRRYQGFHCCGRPRRAAHGLLVGSPVRAAAAAPAGPRGCVPAAVHGGIVRPHPGALRLDSCHYQRQPARALRGRRRLAGGGADGV